MNIKKVSIVLLIITLLLLGGCSKQDGSEISYDNIPGGESDITKEEVVSIFTPLEEPFGYTYTSYKNAKARFEVPYPSKWEGKVVNDRHFTITNNTDDLYFKNITIHIVTDFSAYYDNPSANDALSIFRTTLPTLPIKINGKEYIKLPYDYPEVVDSKEYILKNNPDVLFYTLDKNLETITKTGNLNKETAMTNICYYVSWPLRPTLISIIGEASQREDITKLGDYMISHIKQYEDKSNKSMSTNISPKLGDMGLVFSLPGEWVEAPLNTLSPFKAAKKYEIKDSTSIYSGMTVTSYLSVPEDFKEISIPILVEQLADVFICNAFSEKIKISDLKNIHHAQFVNGIDLAGVEADVNIIQTYVYKYNSTIAPSIPEGSEIITYLVILYKEKEFVITAFTGLADIQSQALGDVVDLFLETVSVKL